MTQCLGLEKKRQHLEGTCGPVSFAVSKWTEENLHLDTLACQFRMDTMLAGSFDLCDDFGHTNFDKLCTLFEVSLLGPGLNGSALIKDVQTYQIFLKTNFS